MTRQSGQLAPEGVAGTGRGPVAPRFICPLIDGLLGTRPATVLEVRAETPTILRLLARIGLPRSQLRRSRQTMPLSR